MKLKKILNKKSLRYIFFFLTFIPLVTFFYFNIPIWRVRAAATIVWDGGGDGTSWSDPLNWDTDTVPVPADVVLIETVHTVNISQAITVSGLTLGKAAVSTASVLNFAYDAQLAGAFTITDGDLTIYPGASITHTIASGSTVVGNVNINIQNGNANIYGNINTNAKGYTAGNGPGGVGYTGSGAAGASHTGYGGDSNSGAVGGTVIYGLYNQPTTLGSGGGNASGTTGGTGGGSVKLTVSGNVVIGGNITANANSGTSSTYAAGGGSGGSIWISCTSISGAGNITANGGNGGTGSNRVRDGGGGSGGRISISYTGTNDIAQTQFSAKGGDGVNTGSQRGGAGSIFLKASASSGELVFDNKTSFASNHFLWNAKTPIPSSLLVETLTITNYAHIVPTNTITADSINITGGGIYYNQNSTTVTYNTIDDWAGGIIVDNGGTFAIVSSGISLTIPVGSRLEGNTARTFSGLIIDGVLTHTENTSSEANLINYTINGDVSISNTGSINVNGQGYSAGNGPGGVVYTGSGAAGASFTGYGGSSNSGAVGGDYIYGSYTQPFNLGSGGGNASGATGGSGGGIIKLTVSGSTTVNGSITANGGAGINTTYSSGGGSGGSIWITSASIVGTGNISANGGAGGTGSNRLRDGGGGSGGRISLNYTTTNGINQTQLSAKGGDGINTGSERGGAGSIYTKASTAPNGDLLFDNKTAFGSNHFTSNAKTPLPSNLVIDTLTITNYAHLLAMNTSTAEVINITNGGTYFNQISTTTTYNSLNWPGGVIVDNGGTFAVVSSGSSLLIPTGSTLEGNTTRTFTALTVDGLLTHTENVSAETYKINFTVNGDLTISGSGSINVNEKGYKAGYGSGGAGYTASGAGGASHAAYGGSSQSGAAGGAIIYGTYNQPNSLGSGGGNASGATGGSGGGVVKLTVSGNVAVGGHITANAGSGMNTTYASGGGSGGSIWISCTSISGAANITANGGNGGTGSNRVRDGGGGSAGRIFINYSGSNSITQTQLSARGGNGITSGSQKAGAGTIFLKPTTSNGELLIDNKTEYGGNHFSWNAKTPLPASLTLEKLNVTNYSHVLTTSTVTTNSIDITNSAIYYNQNSTSTVYTSIDWEGGSIVDNGGTLAVVSSGASLLIPINSTLEGNTTRTFSGLTVNGLLTHTENTSAETYKVNYTINGNVSVSTTGSIDVNGKGYSATNGSGKGGNSSYGGGGASYVGYGGNGTGGVGGTTIYGSHTQPFNLGSGGGNGHTLGGSGGGIIKLIISGDLTVGGDISANGDPGVNTTSYNNSSGGGGAGGSIWISSNSISGTANITANGGSGGNGYNRNLDGGGGSGGRISLNYVTSNTMTQTQLSAMGGNGVSGGSMRGGVGTIYLKASSATNGNLMMDNKTIYGSNHFSWNAKTPLPSSLVIDTLTITNYSHVLPANTVTADSMNITGYSMFFNQNTTTTTYNNLFWIEGIIVDNGGSFAVVSSGASLTVPSGSRLEANVPRTFAGLIIDGLLTHTENTDSETYKIDLTVNGNVTINGSGSINANGKGYTAGYGSGTGTYSANGGSGAAFGGTGGSSSGVAGSTNVYGSSTHPFNLGSGGGSGHVSGGAGGGIVKLIVSGNLIVEGNITANGNNGSSTTAYNNSGGGGGSGGSIWISCSTLSGTASVTANGGNGGTGYNSTRHGGGGGGGRISLYYQANTSNFLYLTTNTGTATANATAGTNGTISSIGLPFEPINLRQYRIDGTTLIAEGGTTNEPSMIVKFQVRDGDSTDTLTPEVEIQPLGTSFNNIATDVGDPVAYSGSAVTAQVTVTELADNESYHWQARSCDASDFCSQWVSYGSNTEADPDVTVTMNTPPNTPTIPESSYYINGQYTNYLRPTLGFVLSDPNSSDTVGYRIQIDTDSEFSSPVVDYTSGLSAQGTQLFTVGQAGGEGTYTVGVEEQELVTAGYYWRVKAIDNKEAESSWAVAPGTPAFQIDLSTPTNATDVRMKAYAEALHEYEESEDDIWFNRNDLFFKWGEGTDDQGVKGYCLYLGQDPEGDPAENKGILGSSPVSTTGSNCQFIIDDTEIDFSETAFRNYTWLFSSNTKFYFKVKTIDIANNVYVGPDETNFISFKFDNTPPQNVTAISSPSSTYSSTSDIFFQWPTSSGQGASDNHSQLLGFQYAINTQDTWYGDLFDEFTSQNYTLLSTEQPKFLPVELRDLIQLGQNTLFFRVIDKAGNFSELRTAFINYGGEAPKFAEGTQVTVTPTQSATNSFAFSWPEAIVSDGNTLYRYYYMINTPPPVSYATITSNSATYIPTTSRSVDEYIVPGLRKGSNTINVVAVDEEGNYSSANSIAATFYLNSELPDPPSDLIIADSSLKDASLWRAALIWDEPEYMGTGSLTYHIQRSDDGEGWSTVAETTGKAYIDTVTSSQKYYWRVGSTDNSDESISNPSFTNAVTLVPRGKYTLPPNITSGPASSSITTTRSTITWTTSRTADSKVAIGLASGNYFEWEPSISTHKTEHRIPLSNLTPGTTYYYKAKWTDEDGNTGESEEKTFTTQSPPTVQDVRLSNLGVSSTILNLTTINASKAKIYYGTTTSFGGMKEIATSKLETTYAVEIDKLEDGTKYYFQINTFDEEGQEYNGTILDFTTMPRPRVSNILVQQVARTADSTLLVTWESNTSISSVITYYPESNPELVKDVVNLDLKKGDHKLLIKGLFPDTIYVIRVRGKDIIGNEAVSDPIRVTTASDTRPPQISGLSVEGTNVPQTEGAAQSTSSQLIVTWTTDEPATSQVEYGEGSGTVYSQLTQEDKTLAYNHVVIISGLTPSKVYHLRAISTDVAGNEAKSIDTVTITPKATNNAFYLVITTLSEAFGFLDKL